MTSAVHPSIAMLGRVAIFALIVAIVGLPINELPKFALLVIAVLLIAVGEVRASRRAWLCAFGVALFAIAVQILLSPPRIEEGHNVFLVGGENNALITGLPPDVYRLMAEEFDEVYPPERRCDPSQAGCWRGGGFPSRPFAFSADGIYGGALYSRRIAGIGFNDPVWLRLGFINDSLYNWNSDVSDVKRLRRDGRFWMGLHRWQVLMPWFVMYQFPAEFAGADLCWKGDVIWEERNERFALLNHPNWTCRTLESDDAGRRIFGVAIRPASLAMNLDPPLMIQLRQLAAAAVMVFSVVALLSLLLRWRARRTLLPFAIVGLSLLVIAINDASFIGGVRPFDAGDDGLAYQGLSRQIVGNLLAGNISEALRAGENVYFYGGPGFRYLRAFEHLIFGESYLGYLALVLLLPFAVYAAFVRFLPTRWALALAAMFVVIPLGALFGTTFFHYSKWAARGFADPAAVIAAICGYAVLVRNANGAADGFGPACRAAFLFAMAAFIRPNIAPFIAVMLAGSGLAALYTRAWRRLAGLCVGFLPIILMPLHNWYFGGSFTLARADPTHPLIFVTPPSVYAAAMDEMLRLDPAGENLSRVTAHLGQWLSGPSELPVMIPLHAAAIGILVYVAVRGRAYDPWLRLTALACLVQHAVFSLFYIATPRYHFLSWFMTFLVTVVWLRTEALPFLRARYPALCDWAARQPMSRFLAAFLDALQRAAGLADNAAPARR